MITIKTCAKLNKAFSILLVYHQDFFIVLFVIFLNKDFLLTHLLIHYSWRLWFHHTQSLNYAFQITTIFANGKPRIPTIIFFALTIMFTLALTFSFFSILFWITFCAIKFLFTIKGNMVYECFWFIYSFQYMKYFNIYATGLTRTTYFSK